MVEFSSPKRATKVQILVGPPKEKVSKDLVGSVSLFLVPCYNFLMILLWDLYEIRCGNESLHNVMLRGRIRKFTIENEIACLVENAQEEENVVRFGVIAGSDIKLISGFIKSILSEANIVASLKNIPNPVLSKLKVNDLSRY